VIAVQCDGRSPGGSVGEALFGVDLLGLEAILRAQRRIKDRRTIRPYPEPIRFERDSSPPFVLFCRVDP
jgi:hypothetical protein